MWSFSFITSDWGGDQLLWPATHPRLPAGVLRRAERHARASAACRRQRLKYASGLFNMMRNLGGAVGIARVQRDPERPHQFAFSVLASNLTAAHAPVTAPTAGP